MKNIFCSGKIAATFLLSAVFVDTLFAASLDWNGIYRFEHVTVDRPSLDTPSRKSYGLNYLSLNPRIIASDGIEVRGQIDFLPNQDAAYDAPIGQVWGLRTSAGTYDSNVLSKSKRGSGPVVRELYLNVNEENGSLLVGRAPFDFGLGIVWNAGKSPFDHWTTNADLVAYKFLVGNWSFMPMISQVSVPGPEQINLLQDQTFQFQYESDESGSKIGAIMSRRQGSASVNDISAGATGVGGAGATRNVAFNVETRSFFLSKSWESFKFEFEAAFLSGDLGVSNSAGTKVKQNGYGMVVDMKFPRAASKWDFGMKLGLASGDDPTTTDNYEAFHFHRNYDVGFLLFNHRMGQRDFLQTNLIKDTTKTVSTSLDDEAVGNAFFAAFDVSYQWNDRWDVNNKFIYAQTVTNPTNSTNFQKELGYEWDLGLTYKPRSNVRWVNELGMFMPGTAFKDGASNLTNGFNFGFATKAAITF